MAAERSPNVARADVARRSVAVPNGEGVASGSATRVLKKSCNKNQKKEKACLKKVAMLKPAKNLCCAARGHALAVCHLLALLVRQTSSARRNINCQKFKNLRVFHQSPFARKALCTTGRAGPLACAAAADRLRP